MDIDEEKLAKASKAGIKAIKADLNVDKLPLEGEHFNVGTALEVLEHRVNPGYTLREAQIS